MTKKELVKIDQENEYFRNNIAGLRGEIAALKKDNKELSDLYVNASENSLRLAENLIRDGHSLIVLRTDFVNQEKIRLHNNKKIYNYNVNESYSLAK